MQRFVFGLMVAYVFAVPWEYSLDLGEPFGNVARVLGILLLLGVGLLVLRRGRVRSPGPVQWLTAGLLLYFVCSCLWTVDQETTLGKIRAYAQVMMVVWLAWEVVEGAREVRWLLRALVAGCWMLAGLTFLNYGLAAAGLGSAEQVRFVAEGLDPNDAARFLDLGFAVAAWLFATEVRVRWRGLGIVYLPVGLTAVLLTGSRGGFSGAVVALVGSAALLIIWRKRMALVVLGGLGVAGGGLSLMVPVETLERLGTIPSEVGSGDLNDRVQIWAAGWRAFRDSPLWGTGAGTFTDATGLAPGDTAHNTGLAMLVMVGLAGTTIFMAILLAVGRAAWRTGGLLRVALGTVLVVWFVTAMVGSVEENRMTWLLFALMALAERERLTAREPGIGETRLALRPIATDIAADPALT